jgi:hypothetical protein
METLPVHHVAQREAPVQQRLAVAVESVGCITFDRDDRAAVRATRGIRGRSRKQDAGFFEQLANRRYVKRDGVGSCAVAHARVRVGEVVVAPDEEDLEAIGSRAHQRDR